MVWFGIACAVGAAMLALAFYRLRIRMVAAAISARFDERLAERTRLARELHDTLLQTIQASKMVADDALDPSADADHVHRAMSRLSGWLGQAIQEGRAALNSLRTSTIEGNDLEESFRRAAQDCLMQDSMEVVVSVDGEPRNVHPIVRDEVYRIGYEAIRNACLHAEAARLEIALSYAPDFSLRVTDNGKGIDPGRGGERQRRTLRPARDAGAGGPHWCQADVYQCSWRRDRDSTRRPQRRHLPQGRFCDASSARHAVDDATEKQPGVQPELTLVKGGTAAFTLKKNAGAPAPLSEVS